MPAAANIVLNDAGAVARTFELVSPASGDGGWANWRYKDGNTPVSWKAIAIRTSVNASQTARKANIKLKVPVTTTDTSGLVTLVATWDMDINVTVPNYVGVDKRPDCAAFAKNLLANAIVQSILQDAFPAT